MSITQSVLHTYYHIDRCYDLIPVQITKINQLCIATAYCHFFAVVLFMGEGPLSHDAIGQDPVPLSTKDRDRKDTPPHGIHPGTLK